MTPQRFNILLIDDNPEAANLFEVALSEVAPRATIYWVATAEEGVEAIERRERFRDILGFDIVILDLHIGPVSGFEVLQRIRSNAALPPIPIIVMSTSRSREDVLRAYRSGANSFVVKPISMDSTFAVVGTLTRYWLDTVALPFD